MSRASKTIHLGFAVGTGEPVAIPLAHTFVTGQTQLSGKTTTLRAIVGRSHCRALAFVTKRGESFEGRRIKPFLPRESDKPISWRLVETIMATVLGQRSMGRERFGILNAAKGSKSLLEVRERAGRLMAKAKGSTAEMYELLCAYLDLVLPEMKELRAADALDLRDGLNVMDLGGVGPQLQALVIRAALEHINTHETGVLTVFPEAWEFAPRARSAPAKDEAVNMARKGGVLGNFLLCDSQDIAGVDTVVRQATSVWILGVQRELNELRRTIDSIPAHVKKPKPAEVATLGVGQFFACWDRHVVKTYVWPVWMDEDQARSIAMGSQSIGHITPPPVAAPRPEIITDSMNLSPKTPLPISNTCISIPQPEIEDDMSKEDVEEIKESIAALGKQLGGLSGLAQRVNEQSPGPHRHHDATGVPIDEDALFERFKRRLVKESPALIKTMVSRPEIQVSDERPVIEADKSVLGRIALLIADGFFKEPRQSADVSRELTRRGVKYANVQLGKAFSDLKTAGALTQEQDGLKQALDVKIVRK